MEDRPMHWAFYRLMEIYDHGLFVENNHCFVTVVPCDRLFNYLYKVIR